MGRLFVITDTTAERDILTGFHNWESFRTTTLSSTSCFAYPVVTAVCDINGLQEINDTMGRSAGDKAICRLADCMRDFFPEGTYFIRGREASLLALCYRTSEAEVGERLTSIA